MRAFDGCTQNAKTGISARHTISAASAQSYSKNSRLSQYTTGMEKCKEKVEKGTTLLKIYQIENLEEVWYTWRRFGRKPKEGFKMLQKICPICDHEMKTI